MARGKKKKTTLRSIYVIEGKDEVSVMKVIEPEPCPVFSPEIPRPSRPSTRMHLSLNVLSLSLSLESH